jgi:hypothetical protein
MSLRMPWFLSCRSRSVLAKPLEHQCSCDCNLRGLLLRLRCHRRPRPSDLALGGSWRIELAQAAARFDAGAQGSKPRYVKLRHHQIVGGAGAFGPCHGIVELDQDLACGNVIAVLAFPYRRHPCVRLRGRYRLPRNAVMAEGGQDAATIATVQQSDGGRGATG